MCTVVTPKEMIGVRQVLSAKWIDYNGGVVAVSPTTKCIHMLSDPSHTNGIKSEGVRASH
jgi:hypothetical protein